MYGQKFSQLMGWKGQMCMLVVIWWAVSAAITVVMKQTVGTQGQYQFPFALTALTNGACGCISMCACYCQKGKFWANHSLRRIDVCQLLFLGVLQGVEIGMSNKSLEFLSVSARTILNSTSVFFMMLSAQFWGLERLDRLRILSAGLQVTGGFLTGLGASQAAHVTGSDATKTPHNAHDGYSAHAGTAQGSRASPVFVIPVSHQISGTLLQLTTLLIASQRWVMLQFIMQKSNMLLGKLELAAWIMPVTSLVCFTMAAAFETQALNFSLILNAGLPKIVLIIACGITVLTIAEMRLVHISSAVALQVLGTLHQIPLVITGVMFFQDSVEVTSGMDFTCCLLGALCYARAKHGQLLDRGFEEQGATELLTVRDGGPLAETEHLTTLFQRS